MSVINKNSGKKGAMLQALRDHLMEQPLLDLHNVGNFLTLVSHTFIYSGLIPPAESEVSALVNEVLSIRLGLSSIFSDVIDIDRQVYVEFTSAVTDVSLERTFGWTSINQLEQEYVRILVDNGRSLSFNINGAYRKDVWVPEDQINFPNKRAYLSGVINQPTNS